LQQAPLSEDAATEPPDDSKMPGAMEATEGVAPELVTHDEGEAGIANGDGDLSVEEQAVHGMDNSHDNDGSKKGFEENGQIVELAEGRDNPPTSGSAD